MTTNTAFIIIEDRTYTAWKLCDLATHERLPIDDLAFCDPAKHRLFSNDVIEYSIADISPTEKQYTFIRVVRSPIKSQHIAGVLHLENNKTFGRTKNKRLLYKCIPNDAFYPAFLIPYDIKIGFQKNHKNKYIIFQFAEWDSQAKMPHGTILQTIGDVDKLDAFYEYQIYCRSLYANIADFTKKTRECFAHKPKDAYSAEILNTKAYNIVADNSPNIFTIDPPNSGDYDDAFSVAYLPPGPNGETRVQVAIYISNVFFWLETMGLWNSFSKRVATIYLPDYRRPMLPTILADTLCSLTSDGDQKYAFRMRFTVILPQDVPIGTTPDTGAYIDYNTIEYHNVAIRVAKNWAYDDFALLADADYNILANITRKIDPRVVDDSHDIVAFWMIQMNRICGEKMAADNIGIFRQAYYTRSPTTTIESQLPNIKADTARILNGWNNTVGQYILYSSDANLKHELMEQNAYIHITSPIRRIVDLLNQMLFMRAGGMITVFSREATEFLDYWCNNIEYINTTMRSIRKIQVDCYALQNYISHPEWTHCAHRGITFDRVKKHDDNYSYMVYFEELKFFSRIITPVVMENYSVHEYRIFLFEDENKLKNKLRLAVI